MKAHRGSLLLFGALLIAVWEAPAFAELPPIEEVQVFGLAFDPGSPGERVQHLEVVGSENNRVAPPPAEANRYLRTPKQIEDLIFTVQDREGWELSGVRFGVTDGRLMFASFLSVSPSGSIGAVDKSRHANSLVDDTSHLPGAVFQSRGGELFRLVGFTLGRADSGEAYVDWAHAIGPKGERVVSTYESPENLVHEPSLIPLCKLASRAICAGVCSGSCVVAGSDPCDCNGTGFCFVDYYHFFCISIACDLPTKCALVSYDFCDCYQHREEPSDVGN